MNDLQNRKPFHEIHFDSIQVLRGIAAMLVLSAHIRFLGCGAFGVDIFFCISGFISMLTTEQRTENYLRKRLLRIVPFYYLMTLVTYVVLLFFPSLFMLTTASVPNLIKSLLFIPFDLGQGAMQPLMRIGWTLNCEVFFYLLFGLAMRISHKYRGVLCGAFLALCVLIGALVSGGNVWTGAPLVAAGENIPSLLAPIYFFSNPVMLEFALGILCYSLASACYRRLQTCSLRTAKCIGGSSIAFALALILVLILSYDYVNILGYRRLLLWGLPSMLILFGFLLGGFSLRMPSPGVKLGNISFSLYLIHYYPLMLLDRKVFDFSTLTLRSGLGALLGIILVICLAIASWYLIEKRLTGWLRKKLLR